jgi:predicted dienelactone hydrolase
MHIVFALACTGSSPSTDAIDTDINSGVDPLVWPADAAGPYNAGHQVIDVSYTDFAGSPRTIPLNLWYPTDDTQGDSVVYEGLWADDASLGNAALATAAHAQGHPVLVHSHGHLGFAGNSAFLHRWFASHGWVVAVPDHVGNTFTNNIDPRPVAIYAHRAHDISASLDYLEQNDSWDAVTDRVVMAGHSFGVFTVWASGGATFDTDGVAARCEGDACPNGEADAFLEGLGDDRIIAHIPMAGSIGRDWFGDSGHRSIKGPVLSMTGTNDDVGQQGQFDSMDDIDFTSVDINGACHQAFGIGGCSQIDDEVVFPLVSTWALSFANEQLFGLSQFTDLVAAESDELVTVEAL